MLSLPLLPFNTHQTETLIAEKKKYQAKQIDMMKLN